MPKPASATPDFVVHCLELLAPLGPVRARRMFSGHGIDLDGLMLAIVVGEQLYMKVDATTQPHWAAAGSRPFEYESRRDGTPRRIAMSYWLPPNDAMESPGPMWPWARLALEAALRTRAAKAAPRAFKTPKKKAG